MDVNSIATKADIEFLCREIAQPRVEVQNPKSNSILTELLTPEEVMKHHKISESGLKTMHQRKEIKYKLYGKIYYRYPAAQFNINSKTP